MAVVHVNPTIIQFDKVSFPSFHQRWIMMKGNRFQFHYNDTANSASECNELFQSPNGDVIYWVNFCCYHPLFSLCSVPYRWWGCLLQFHMNVVPLRDDLYVAVNCSLCQKLGLSWRSLDVCTCRHAEGRMSYCQLSSNQIVWNSDCPNIVTHSRQDFIN